MESCGKSTERWRGGEQSVSMEAEGGEHSVSMEAEGGERAENKEERGETREVQKETFQGSDKKYDSVGEGEEM